MSLNQVHVKRKKAEWCDKNTEIMLKVCIEEVNAGNKPHNHFTKLGWANIVEKFNKATNLRYEYKQFRNRNGNYGLSLLGRTQVLAEMGRRKPLQLVMNGGKRKFRLSEFLCLRVCDASHFHGWPWHAVGDIALAISWVFFLVQTQVDVPFTCTTKDVPSNVLRQRSQAVKPLKLCEWGYKRILRREWEESKEFLDCVVLNSLTREQGDTKEFRRLVLCFIGKGRRETQKEFRRLEDPEVAKFREQGLKFLPEMEFLFKGTIATGFAAYAPSEDSRQYEGFNTRTEETNDNIDDNTDMEVNEPEIDTTTQNTSSAKENGQRKRG
ncbi:L10-interacting MYB domain-containing protein [Glycine soja]